MENISKYLKLADLLSTEFSNHPSVESIALGGSLSSGPTDKKSDIDLYIFTISEVPLSFRQSIVEKFGASRKDLNLTFWDLGDEWIHAETGIEVDVIFWDRQWITEQVNKVIHQHQASMGYTTSFWYTILNAKCQFDRNQWFSNFQNSCKIDYPDDLQRAIVQKNFPVLKDVIPSYYEQIKKAIHRNDILSINHRLTAFFASYFDVIFALNKIPNPGEKKVVQFVLENCSILPKNAIKQIDEVFGLLAENQKNLLNILEQFVEDIRNLLTQNNLL